MLYSTEQVAEMLGLHVRTVRGYVRDGRLHAVRIGKQYRVSREDLEKFTGGHPAAPDDAARPGRAEVSAVVDIAEVSPDAMTRLTTLVTGAAGGRAAGGVPLHIETVYDERRAALKIIVIGPVDDAARVLTIIGALTGEQA